MKTICLLGILSITAFGVSAQPAQVQDQINSMIPKPVPTSPNVAALGKFGDYKVSLFTGLPEISIPIFEAKSGEVSVPITLNYHASGIKPTDVASWVGAGWSISSGGQVSRSVNGKPDEEHFYSHALEANPSICGTFTYLEHSARHVSDTEPDVFSYSYPGRSGKFLLPSGSSPYLIPYAPILINPNYTPFNFPKFEVTDESGVLYQYGIGTKGTSKEFTNATSGGNPTLAATTSWHLMEIISPNSDDQISFEYQNVGNAFYHDIVETYTILDQCNTTNGFTCPSVSDEPTRSNIDSNVNQQGLKTIYFETGKVEFVLGNLRVDANQLRTLDRIEIYAKVKGAYVKQKTVKFIYSYFINPGFGNPSDVALKLDALEFRDAASVVIQNYKLTYTSNDISWIRGSDYILLRRDLWGYYNGSVDPGLVLKKSVPWQPNSSSQSVFKTIGSVLTRDVNPLYSKEGVLSRIDFPTGGNTSFEYESNKYLENGIEKLAGGLRVTKIISNDGNGSSVIKSYRYGQNESGYGFANFNIQELNYSSEQKYTSSCGTVDPNYSYISRTWHSNSALSQDAFDSSPVVYTNVTEYLGDPSNNTTGKTVYEFRNIGDVSQVIPYSGKYFRDSNFWKRGQLRHKTVYDKFNNKLSETDIGYSEHKLTSKVIGIGVHERLTGNIGVCSGASLCQNESGDFVNTQTFSFSTFSQNTGALLEGLVTEYVFKNGDLNQFVMNERLNTYDADKLQMIQSIRNRSNSSEQLVTVNRYPFQLSGNVNSSSTGPARGIYLMNSRNILRTPLETFTYLQNVNQTNQRIISGQVTTYRQNESNANQVVADKIFLWESVQPLEKQQYSITGINGTSSDVTKDPGYKLRAHIVGYDVDGNIIEVRKTDDATLSYQWAYDNALPVVEVKNAFNKNVFHTSFEEAISGISLEGKTGNQSSTSGFTQPLTNLDAGTYKLSYYQKQGASWILNQSTVQVTSGNYTINIPGQVDEVRFYPIASQMTTYTYDPIYGMTSMTDVNNFVTYYDYDEFGRLKAVKDDERNIAKTYKYNYKNEN